MKMTIAAGPYQGTYDLTVEAGRILADAWKSFRQNSEHDYSAVCAVMELGLLNGQIVKNQENESA